MVDLSADASPIGLWQLSHVHNLRLFFPEKTVQLLVDITVKLRRVPSLSGLILFPPRIVFPVPVIDPCLAPHPLRVLRLIPSQFLPVPVSLVRGQHSVISHGYSHHIGVVLVAFHRHIHRRSHFQFSLIGIQPDIQLSLVLVVVCQGDKDPLSLFLYGNSLFKMAVVNA